MTAGDVDLRASVMEALEADDPVDAVMDLVARARSRELLEAAEPLRNLGRRCHGAPGDRHRRAIANQCAELVVRRAGEITRRRRTTHV